MASNFVESLHLAVEDLLLHASRSIVLHLEIHVLIVLHLEEKNVQICAHRRGCMLVDVLPAVLPGFQL